MAAMSTDWRARADTARRLAEALNQADAKAVLEFALECETRATCVAVHGRRQQRCVRCPLAAKGPC